MEINSVTQIIGCIISAFASIKYFYDYVDNNRKKLKDNFEFSKNFFEYIDSKKEVHPLVIECGYHVIANNDNISKSEIDYLLSFDKPFFAIRKYVNAIDCLEFDEINTTFHYIKLYKTKRMRITRKIIGLMLYFMLAFFAVFFVWLFLISKSIDTNSLLNFIIIIPGTCFFAYKCLRWALVIHHAEQVMGMKDKYLLKHPVNG